MKTPDFTPAALTALAVAVLNDVYVLFSLNMTDAQKGAITGIVNGVFVVGFLAHDAFVRRGRAKVVQAQAEAEQLSVNLGPVTHEAPAQPAP